MTHSIFFNFASCLRVRAETSSWQLLVQLHNHNLYDYEQVCAYRAFDSL